MWGFEQYGMDEFLAWRVLRMEQFLRGLERVEAKSASAGGQQSSSAFLFG